ncbi:Xylose isomerase-like TIM barrel domain-containing protein OS=Streptomyces fumanus OX=67302 GN=GCM10018772_35600 PE=4 SV=1 [Streptomyces fumanus]
MAAALDRIRVGSAPDSWGVWFPDDPHQVPWERFLDEVAEAGYSWIEMGPYGICPPTPPASPTRWTGAA